MDVLTKDQALNFPRTCVFTGDGDGPFLDTNIWLNAKEYDGAYPYGYVSVGFVKTMGRAIGMVPAEDVEQLKAQVVELADKYESLAKYAEAIETLEQAAPTPDPDPEWATEEEVKAYEPA